MRRLKLLVKLLEDDSDTKSCYPLVGLLLVGKGNDVELVEGDIVVVLEIVLVVGDIVLVVGDIVLVVGVIVLVVGDIVLVVGDIVLVVGDVVLEGTIKNSFSSIQFLYSDNLKDKINLSLFSFLLM